MLVTVVIPAYNAAATISRTLASVLAQTHSQLEILVVDDGSKDNTAEIVASFRERDRRVQLLSQPNGGIARARNLGIQHAKAELIAPVDADDLWHPTKLEKQVNVMFRSSAQPSFVYCCYRTIDEEDRVIRSAERYQVSGFARSRLMLVNFVGNGSSPLFCRRALLAVGGYDSSLRDSGIEGAEDYLLQSQVARLGPVEVVPEYLVGYRRSTAGASRDVKAMIASEHETRLRMRALNDADDEAFRWGSGVRLSDGALRHLRRGHVDAALHCLAQAVELDPFGAGYHLAFQAVLLARHEGHRWARKSPLVPARLRERWIGRPFYHYDPTEEAKEPTWLIARRLKYLAAKESSLVRARSNISGDATRDRAHKPALTAPRAPKN